MRDIKLSGSEISLLRAIGLVGTTVSGDELIKKISGFTEVDFLDTLQGLVITGFVNADRDNLHDMEDVKHSSFSVNTAYSRDLRDMISGRTKERPSRRRRRRE
ncbi:MAG: hypothetical protein ACFCU3_11385 [Verrucomicrobiales bacterium]